MRYRLALPALGAILLLPLSACSSGSPDSTQSDSPSAAATSAPASRAGDGNAESEPTGSSASPEADDILALEGLGDLRIGQPVPSDSSWAERGAQISEECRTVSSPRYPGVYAIVTGDKVRRITLGQRSTVLLAEGIGPGASETEVTARFPGFREEPHAYSGAPAKYLTAPVGKQGGPALRFEIGPDGKVSLIHVGTMPELSYVEGCA